MKNIILIGMKGCGKTTVCQLLSQIIGWDFIEVDNIIESMHEKNKGEELSCSNIFKTYGEKYFRTIETEACHEIAKLNQVKSAVISCGGGTAMSNNNQNILKRLGTIIFLNTNKKILMQRILSDEIPAYIKDIHNPEIELMSLMNRREKIYRKFADHEIIITFETPEEIVKKIRSVLHI